MTKIIRVGSMPGKIQEVAVEVGTTIKEVLEIAELEVAGKEVKIDGVVSELTDVVTESTKLVLLVSRVKGNGLVKIGVMPGRITEIAVEDDATVAEIIEIAELDAEGYEVKVDGVKSELDTVAGTAKLVLLARKVKGN